MEEKFYHKIISSILIQKCSISVNSFVNISADHD